MRRTAVLSTVLLLGLAFTLISRDSDARLQKAFTIGTHRLTAIVDAYNLLNMALEVEEVSVTGATSRLTSAVQPPRVVQIGARLGF